MNPRVLLGATRPGTSCPVLLFGRPLALLLCFGFTATAAASDELSNDAFRIQHDASGIRSLKRTNDVHDTDYILPGEALGRLLVRYRTSPHGDWYSLREPMAPAVEGRTLHYTLGTRPPALDK